MAFECEQERNMNFRRISERVNAHISLRSLRGSFQCLTRSCGTAPWVTEYRLASGLWCYDYFMLLGFVASVISGLTFCSMPRSDGLRMMSFAGMRLILKRSANSMPNLLVINS